MMKPDALLLSVLTVSIAASAFGQQDRFESLAKLPMEENRPTAETSKTLLDELTFQRATESYLWGMALLNTMGMHDGFADSFGTGYNIMAHPV